MPLCRRIPEPPSPLHRLLGARRSCHRAVATVGAMALLACSSSPPVSQGGVLSEAAADAPGGMVSAESAHPPDYALDLSSLDLMVDAYTRVLEARGAVRLIPGAVEAQDYAVCSCDEASPAFPAALSRLSFRPLRGRTLPSDELGLIGERLSEHPKRVVVLRNRVGAIEAYQHLRVVLRPPP